MVNPAPKQQAASPQPRQLAIAVVGEAALLPRSPTWREFWPHLKAGRDLLSDVPESHWRAEDYHHISQSEPDRIASCRGGFLDPVWFDPLEWGVPPKQLPATDTVQLLSLVVAKQALEDVPSYRRGAVDRRRVGCVVGVGGGTELIGQMAAKIQRPVWRQALRQHDLGEEQIEAICRTIFDSYPEWTEATFPGLLANVVAGRIANRFDLSGPNFTTDAACASALSAVSTAAHLLTLGEADMMLTGGADASPSFCFASSETSGHKSNEACLCASFIAKARQVGNPHFLQFVFGRSLNISTPVNAISTLHDQ